MTFGIPPGPWNKKIHGLLGPYWGLLLATVGVSKGSAQIQRQILLLKACESFLQALTLHAGKMSSIWTWLTIQRLQVASLKRLQNLPFVAL